jgi:hypothetical protein
MDTLLNNLLLVTGTTLIGVSIGLFVHAIRLGNRAYHEQNTGLTPGQGGVYAGGHGDSTQAGYPQDDPTDRDLSDPQG